ncbi:MAG: hypothetical protein ACTTKH_06005 [Treponema sp.]
MKGKSLFLNVVGLTVLMSFFSCGNPAGGTDEAKNVEVTKVKINDSEIKVSETTTIMFKDATPFEMVAVSVMGKLKGATTETKLEVESINPAKVTPTNEGADFKVNIKAGATYEAFSISLKAKIGTVSSNLKDVEVKAVLINDKPADLVNGVMVLAASTKVEQKDIVVIGQVKEETGLTKLTVNGLGPKDLTVPASGEETSFTITTAQTATYKGTTTTLKLKAGTTLAKKGVTVTKVTIEGAEADLKKNTIEFESSVTKFDKSKVKVMGIVEGELTEKDIEVDTLAPQEVHVSTGDSFTITTKGNGTTKSAIITLKPSKKS